MRKRCGSWFPHSHLAVWGRNPAPLDLLTRPVCLASGPQALTTSQMRDVLPSHKGRRRVAATSTFVSLCVGTFRGYACVDVALNTASLMSWEMTHLGLSCRKCA